ncbi:hypothetical protein PL321_00510 [Caloramator sp. mosi_1]|uniref:hypothetical protein n=1 Tax=Caloramator sp. mosi_1 TaxID=3023090 RepID=UPI00235FE92C|nr:hypothetical protein [Caloramator sp. mosi_1]WDC84360.1 hypothetical protein PL321_00510 [Caloramator sp. mosi_1]
MKNVLERLELLFDINDRNRLISIESKIDEGTKVTLKIPRFSMGKGGLKVC